MRRYNLFCFTLSMFVVVSLLGGCSGGSGNKEGQQPPPLATTPGAILPDGNLQAEIQGVTINSRPVVTFRLLDENGAPLDQKTAGLSVRFFLARIKDDGNYENYVGDAAGFPSYDATGTFAALGNGVYTYTFATDINDATKTLKGITYSATDTRTHTAALQVSRTVTSKRAPAFNRRAMCITTSVPTTRRLQLHGRLLPSRPAMIVTGNWECMAAAGATRPFAFSATIPISWWGMIPTVARSTMPPAFLSTSRS